MTRLQGFPPLADAASHTLILGSMPGAASLAAAQYYAHPRNLFWPLIGELFGIDPALPYEARTCRLVASGVAVWDVLGACRRAGSLDAAIETDSLEPNDFTAFFAAHPGIKRIFFNGATAEQLFRRHVLPNVAAAAGLACARLPSTSPANAGQSLAAKRDAWRAITT